MKPTKADEDLATEIIARPFMIANTIAEHMAPERERARRLAMRLLQSDYYDEVKTDVDAVLDAGGEGDVRRPAYD